LADSADRAENLELEQIEKAKERAKELLEQKRDEDDVAFARAQAQLEKELNRYKVAKRRRKRSRHRGSNVPKQP
jgi:F0F1-type ATP synthase epsilon subunit